jgi:flagellin FlaB
VDKVTYGSTRKLFVDDKKAAIGTGSLVIFIAMVLVAGIAASVLVQTSTKLESQAIKTGSETTDEVSTGCAVFDIKGYAATGGNIDRISICIRPRAGSVYIDLSETIIELANANYKVILNYTTGDYVADGSGQDDVFGAAFFPATGNTFGLLVLEDADDSCGQTTPVINKGDKVLLGVNTSVIFDSTTGIDPRMDIWGVVSPEIGSPGIIAFTAPPVCNDNIVVLQ